MKLVTILGSTGSIGESTLDVISRHPDAYRVFALSCNSNIEKLVKQCEKFKPDYAVVTSSESAILCSGLLSTKNIQTEVLVGIDGLNAVAVDDAVDIVMSAIVGAIGLEPTLCAVNSGKKVLLANKESLVMAGHLFMQAVNASDAILLPIDSEHNALFQCLPAMTKGDKFSGVKKLLLSASGGPFRGKSMEQLEAVTPEEACVHPNWNMGKKISVDSATLMNKGLELIEASWLFSMPPEKIDIVVHPESVIHSLVQYVDGSVLAQLGNPDMRTPIAHALSWPDRMTSGVDDLDLIELGRLNFESPDPVNFPCLRIALEAARVGLDAPAVLNAANEIAVQAFLDRRIGFTQISEVIEGTLDATIFNEPESLAAVKDSDTKARIHTQKLISKIER
ncbi:MAG: 1-deoxy-D-xylulose-5-phosphate reductoisomerase [Porticoccaceae bacterium]|jgi:1-deoxy-D-xylulose-5-phosphate reductoisomerase|nr:1-deoxy-D-xylulose-5-phosphate reductoisomerase [Porticoccaceae bacterium]